MGRPPIYGKFPFMGRLAIYAKSSHAWNNLAHMGRLPNFPICEVVPIWALFSCVGSLPMHGKSCNRWEDFPYMARLPK
jgi:hypothetical protein